MQKLKINGVSYKVIGKDGVRRQLQIETSAGTQEFWFDTVTCKKVTRAGRGFVAARGSIPGQNKKPVLNRKGARKGAVPPNPLLEAVRHITVGEVIEWFVAYGDAKVSKPRKASAAVPERLQKMFAEMFAGHFGPQSTALERAVKKAYGALHKDPTGEFAAIQAYSLLGLSLGMPAEYIDGLVAADRPSTPEPAAAPAPASAPAN